MNRAQLAKNIATALVQEVWTPTEVERALMRRLPRAVVARAVPKLVATIFTDMRVVAPTLRSLTHLVLGADGFEIVFRYCQKHDVWPAAVMSSTKMHPAPVFEDLDIPQLNHVGAMCAWLGLDLDRVLYLADLHGRYAREDQDAANHYHYHFVPKRSKGVRVIEAPKAQLKGVQRRVLDEILNKVSCHSAAFGFVPGRSSIMGASKHVGEEEVVCFDLANFFPSVGYGRVFGVFRMLGYPEDVSRPLAGFCTNRTPPRIVSSLEAEVRSLHRMVHLPQGAPSSPALANLMAYRLDVRLSGLARVLGLRYTRYADDLTFSGDKGVAATLLGAVPHVVRGEGFKVHPKKIRVMGRGGAQVVTGLVVNDRLNVTRREYDRLKAVIHSLNSAGRAADGSTLDQVRGQISWVQQVNPSKGAKLSRYLKRVLADCS